MLEGGLWRVDALGVVHLIVVQEVLHDVGAQKSILVLVDLAHVWVLPLESNLLFNSIISILLDGLEHSGPQLCFQGA